MSELRANTISDAAGTGPVTLTGQHAAKHWCRMNQAGTQSIQDSFNTSSITDEGVGYTAVTLSNAMANTDWSVQLTGTGATTDGGTVVLDSSDFLGAGTVPYRTTTRFNIRGVKGSDGTINDDHPDANSAAFGDLA